MNRRRAALPHRTPILFPSEEPRRPSPIGPADRSGQSPAQVAGMRGAGDLGADEFEEDDDGFGPDLGSRLH